MKDAGSVIHHCVVVVQVAEDGWGQGVVLVVKGIYAQEVRHHQVDSGGFPEYAGDSGGIVADRFRFSPSCSAGDGNEDILLHDKGGELKVRFSNAA